MNCLLRFLARVMSTRVPSLDFGDSTHAIAVSEVDAMMKPCEAMH